MSEGITAALVTGATGFIGSALARRLARGGARTACLVRARSPRAARLSGVAGIEIIEATSFEPSELRAALSSVKAEVVFHLASYGVNPAQRDPAQMIEGNANLLVRLLLAASGGPLRRFVYTGSCSEYAPTQEPERITELHPLRPISLYGAAKAAAYLYGNVLARQLGVPFVTLRPFGVYGIGEAEHRLVPHLIDHLRRGARPSLTGGEQVRDLTYIDDVVDALIAAATAPRIESYQAYNVCSGAPLRIRAVAEKVASLAGKPDADIGLGERPYRNDEAMWVVGDGTRFSDATGFRPSIGIDEGLRRVVVHALGEAGS
jgi:nucleoside-diphosphate-sugar epimerase